MQDKKFDVLNFMTFGIWYGQQLYHLNSNFFPTTHLESVSEKNILVLILSLASWAHCTHKFGYEIFTSKTVFFVLK